MDASIQRHYYINGLLRFEYFLCANTVEGLYKHFNSFGDIVEEIYYINGIVTEYKNYNLGTLNSVIAYSNGKRHGPCKIYYSNGQLLEESTYIMGLQLGVRKVYNKDGTFYELF